MHFFKRKISEKVSQMPRIKDVVDSVAVQSSEIFTRIIQIWQQPLPDHCNQFKAFLDAGCYAGDLISSEVIAIIGCQDQVHPEDKIIGICLHGHPLRSLGTVVLRWEGVGFYKVFETLFHVVEGNSLPWQVILGANTCAKHNLLTIGAAAFGGSCTPVFPKKEKKDSAKEAARFQKYKEEVATNAARVEIHKKEKAERAEQQRSASGGGASRKEEHRY